MQHNIEWRRAHVNIPYDAFKEIQIISHVVQKCWWKGSEQ